MHTVCRLRSGTRRTPRLRPEGTVPVRLIFCALAASLAGAGACASGDADAGSRRLVAAIDSDPGHLNPAITTSGGVHTASEILYSGLVQLDSASVPHPDLATDWEVLDGGRRYRFSLRDDVSWHDGAPFVADDVVYTFQEVLLQYHSRTRASLGGALSEVRALGPHSVEFVLDAPYAPLLQQLDVTEAPILPAHVFRGSDPLTNPANRAPIGTGPFMYGSTGPGEIRYTANPRFYDGRPWFDDLVLRVVPDPATAVIALESGEVHWMFAVPGPDRARLRAADGIELLETARGAGGSNCVNTLAFNLDRPLFRDRRMRSAVAHAVDRAQLVERVLFGGGRVAAAPISSGIPWAHAPQSDMPGYAADRARLLLDSLGWKRNEAGVREARNVPGIEDGAPLSMDFTHMPGYTGYGEVLRAQLAAVGIDLRPRSLDPAVFAQTVFAERGFDTSVISYCNGPDPEIGVRRQYLSSNIGPVPFSNAAAYANPVMDSLFDAARAEQAMAERGRIYAQIQRLAVRDLPYYWLTESISTRAHSAGCEGFSGGGHYARAARCSP